MLFELGQTVATRGAMLWSIEQGFSLATLLHRHNGGDFGDLCKEDKQLNVDALTDGGRILSAYTINGKKLYVITEHDRSVTTVLLASEY